MRIQWPSKEEMKSVGLICLGLLCLVQLLVIVLFGSMLTDLAEKSRGLEEISGQYMEDYNNLWHDYNLLQDEVFGEQGKYHPECDETGYCG